MKTTEKLKQSHRLSFSFFLLIALLLAACGQESLGPSLEAASGPAPFYNQNNPERIPGSYIVVMKPGVRARAAALGQLPQNSIKFTYDMEGFQGFAVKVNEQALKGLRNNPNVAYVEADAKVTASQVSTSVWGLDRIDQRSLPLNNTYNNGGKTGAGVRAYVIDTGIRATHTEFGGRVSSGYTSISDGYGTNDCQGHGTHVAGTIGGATYGVAKQVTLVPVRVLDCTGSGSYSGVIAGVDWVTNNATLPAVANMSLGGPASQSLDDAVTASIAKGITYVVAAGNDTEDACDTSPARVPGAITVGASDRYDYAPYFSNYGSCIDLFAPGVGVESASNTSDSATATYDGTSMAAPHVAGVVALLGAPTSSPAKISECSTKGIVQNAYSTNNHLLYTCAPTTATYTVNFTSSTVPVGRVISSVSLGRGISSSTGTITSNVGIYAKRSGLTGNMAMVTSTARHLIISKDGSSQTSYVKGGYMNFKFSSFGTTGRVGVKTLKVKNTTTTSGTVKVYRGTTLLKTVSVPKTGLGVTKTLSLNVSNASLVKVTLTGPGAVDNVVFNAPQ